MKSKGSEALLQARKDRGLTQYEAGKLVDMPGQAISSYERGYYKPSRTGAGKLEREFGIPVGDWDETAEAAGTEQPAA